MAGEVGEAECQRKDDQGSFRRRTGLRCLKTPSDEYVVAECCKYGNEEQDEDDKFYNRIIVRFVRLKDGGKYFFESVLNELKRF
jgi:hypothetical protein